MNAKSTTRFCSRAAAAIAVVAIACAGSAVGAGAATAGSGSGSASGRASAGSQAFGAVQARCDAAIQQRFATLVVLTQRVNGAQHLTDADRAALSSQVQTTQSGLTTLKAQIDGDTTPAELRTDCPKIVLDYRVYVLLAPKVHLVAASDAALDAVSLFDQANTTLQSAIATAQSRGRNPSLVSAAQTAQSDMMAKVSDAQSQASPVPGALVPLTPGQYNSGTSALTSARTALTTARGDLVSARADLKTAISDLRQAVA